MKKILIFLLPALLSACISKPTPTVEKPEPNPIINNEVIQPATIPPEKPSIKPPINKPATTKPTTETKPDPKTDDMTEELETGYLAFNTLPGFAILE